MANNVVTIPLHGPSVDIVKNHRLALMDIFLSKFGCVATVSGLDLEREASFAQYSGPTPEKRFAAALRPGVQVSVWKGDLTCFPPAEAVVNAANTALQHSGGLARALSTAGGPQIQRDSNDYVTQNGGVKTGDAIALDAGFLKYKKIIHAVGPDLPYSPSHLDVKQAEPLLQKVIYEILNRVRECRLATVAIPAISSGLFNYPLPACADTIVSAVKHYCEVSPSRGHLPKEIFLVNNDEPTVQAIHRACHKILAPQQPTSYSQATAKNTRGAARASSTTVKIGNIHLTLKKGNIEEQQVDVIVNTASQSGKLSEGQISYAILKKAGYEMQKEMDIAYSTGRVKVTKAYKLDCKEVYHTSCISKGEKWAHEILLGSVTDCLYKAAASGHKSIAFPAIGSGLLRFGKGEVASMMLHAVADFSTNCQRKMDVYFVIFPSDHGTFQAFEEKMRPFGQNASPSISSPAAEEDREDVHSSRVLTPQITLSGPSSESLAEARNWYHKLFSLSRPVEIHNNFILHLGEKEHRQLSRLKTSGAAIEEFFTQGHACIIVQADSKENTVAVVLEVEALLCKIQREFVSEEEREIGLHIGRKVSCERLTIHQPDKEFSDRALSFKKPLRVLKVDRVENPALKTMFELKKQQLKCSSTQKMFQRIPVQFCEIISRIGFQAECAPPEEPKYGEGIYFADTVEAAMRLWKQKNEEFLYFVEAEVLTGNSHPGAPGVILPPPVGADPLHLYDSLSGPNVAVIFSTYQALPKYIITCERG